MTELHEDPSSHFAGMNRRDFLFVILISLLSAYVTIEGFYRTGTLYWDDALFFGIFRDNLDSLNRFGEFAWWFPHKQGGWPAYYYSVLGDLSFFSPVQLGFCAVSFLLGAVRIQVTSFHPWFLIDVGLISPFLVNCGVFLFCRQIFSRRHLSYFAVLLAAFSPGVLFNISDPGFLEPVAYSLFFAAAFIRLLRQPSRSHFYLVVFTCCLLAINLNYPFLFWNLFAIPLFLMCAILFFKKNRLQLRLAFQELRWFDLAFSVAAIALCALPSLIVFSQVGELIRSRMGQKTYELKDLFVGNPLEMLSVGWPGFGFDLNVNQWQLFSPGARHIGITYLGLLCLPLTFVGLVFGRKQLRASLLFFLAIAFTIICLSAYSPLFSLLLTWDTPLRANNHYGDAFFRSGGYLILIFGAVLGLEAVMRLESARKLLPKIFIFWSLISAAFMAWMLKDQVTSEPSFGLFLVMSLFFCVLSLQLKRTKNQKSIRSLLLILGVLTLIDVSTISYFQIRHILASPLRVIDESPASDGLGMAQTFQGEYSSSILMLKPMYEISKSGFNLETLPFLKIFTAAQVSTTFAADLEAFAGRASPAESLALDPKAFQSEKFKEFLTSAASNQPNNLKVEVLKRNYNNLVVKTNSDRKALLFIRDGYSPYWQAFTKQDELPIVPALKNFKAVPIPAGETVIAFQFEPPWVRPALAAAYFILFLILLGLLINAVVTGKRLRAARAYK